MMMRTGFIAEFLMMLSECPHLQGAFSPPQDEHGNLHLINGIRLFVQVSTKDSDSFMPDVISLPLQSYKNMVTTFHLPTQAIEAGSAVGPLFWCSEDHDEDDPHLQIIHRKADNIKHHRPLGREMVLSYSFKSRITSGFVKGNAKYGSIWDALTHLKQFPEQVIHPMLLSMLVLSHDLSPEAERRQRDVRRQIMEFEAALTLNSGNTTGQDLNLSHIDVDVFSRRLVRCWALALVKPSRSYIKVAENVEDALKGFWKRWLDLNEEKSTTTGINQQELATSTTRRGCYSHIREPDFSCAAADNMIQLSNMMAQRDTQFNIESASEQRRIAHASRRDGTAMKTLSFFGALFLPGTFFATIFGTSFFNFEAGASPVSAQLWIYFTITIPVTILVVVFWAWYEAKQQRNDAALEEDIKTMEEGSRFLRPRLHRDPTW
ncbi:hypothetical protein FSARC_348 [Fusarium sarcochroum]|uniref:Uncharacterized protein n=1 Tax=Fusarium sarcochroum TaxID=1208366 RepID=A0A8H4XGA5_9HYPO|nr:hypothetical protein FSARC_348 [Fusarium sarcochroum]